MTAKAKMLTLTSINLERKNTTNELMKYKIVHSKPRQDKYKHSHTQTSSSDSNINVYNTDDVIL